MAPSFTWADLWPCYSCCKTIWIADKATLGGHCAAVVAYIPIWIALGVFVLRYAGRPIWKHRPLWLRNFASEEKPIRLGEDDAPKSKPWVISTILLFNTSLAGIVASLVVSLGFDFGPLYLISIVPCFVSCLIVAIDRPRSTPGAVLVIYFGLLLTQMALLMSMPSLLRSPAWLLWVLDMCIPLVSLLIIAFMPMRDQALYSDGIAIPFETPTSDLISPEDNFTLWHWMTVSWMKPLISIAYARQLHDEDVWLLPISFQHDRLFSLFREVKGSVVIRLLKANGPDCFITTALGILESVASLVQIVFLQQLLAALELSHPDRRVALVYAILILFARLVGAQSGVFSLWFSRRAYERSRGELVTMIYEKTLRRKAFTFPSDVQSDDASTSTATTATTNENDNGTAHPEGELLPSVNGHAAIKPKSPRPSLIRRLTSWAKKSKDPKPPATEKEDMMHRGPASMGKILNLMRNDVYEISQRFWEFPGLVTKPLNFILSLILIWNILGAASLLGILLIVLMQLLNVGIVRILVNWERQRRAVTDLRLQITSQFVEAIRHLRWYDWQERWLAKIMQARKTELRYRVISNLLNKAIMAVNQIGTHFFPVLAFYAFTVIGGKPLTVDIAFPALNLFSMLNQSLRELPGLVTVLLNAAVAVGRVETFLAEPDKEDGHDDSDAPPGDLTLSMANASFSWPGGKKTVLKNVSFECKSGLTVVCGKVGTGKTALLQAILGELDQQSGEKKVPQEMVAYCAQTPWLQSMSIRENILFCSEYEERRYRQVLDACCLIPDLVNFKAGDLANVGENGVGLSGGQKARTALARAIYSKARILLLDDPIAALDHNTAETLLRRLFKNSSLMEGRMVVFVTHRMDLISPYSNQILEVANDGYVRAVEQEELRANGSMLMKAESTEDQHAVAEDEAAQIDKSDVVPDKFIEEERRAHGGVMASVYWRYVRAGKFKWWSILILLFSGFRLARLAHFYFLKIWGEAYGPAKSEQSYAVLQRVLGQAAEGLKNNLLDFGLHNATEGFKTSGFDFEFKFDLGLPSPEEDVRPWLWWFFLFALLQVVFYVASDAFLVVLVYTAARSLFGEVMRKVSNATFRFYDVTPIGRLMNRLTSDIGTIDGQIVDQIQDVAWYILAWAFAVGMIASATPLFLVIAFAMSFTFAFIFNFFLPASQSLRRLEMVSLSPLMSNFGALLDGLTTVRAFRAQPQFQHRNIATTDSFQKMDHFFWSLQAWLQYRFDILSAFSTLALTVAALFTGLSQGTVAFVLSAASNFVNITHILCRKYGQLQMEFVSVERVVELMDLEEEPEGDITPPASWPTYTDNIVFDNVTVRYAPHLEPSLMNLSFTIPAGSTVAVTGRTGSGKSTLALALLGTVLPSESLGEDKSIGSIRIGDIDVTRVNKHALRQRISFVAQDPVLFPGSLRENLDPVGEHSDEECACVLEKVLGGFGEFDLGTRVDGGGKNLSQGQRQLVGLGRAILRRSPVVILDEATASIDVKTAFNIQQVLRDELKESTVITIAHRVEAVKDADYSIILEKGRLLYSGPPKVV